MRTASERWGFSVPLGGVGLGEQVPLLEELVALGYTDVWSSETNGADAFTPLVAAASALPSARLGTAIASVFTRGPALLAMSAASLAALAPGRFALGIGSSSGPIVESWNGVPFERPYARTRDTLHFLQSAFAGERVDRDFETFTIRGFRLADPPSEPLPVLVAALRPRMLRLAGHEADGAIVNWLAAEDVPTVAGVVGEGKEIVARIFVVADPDPVVARQAARRAITGYLTVPLYAEFHRWLGRGPALQAMWDAWERGDRKGANAAVPDDVVDALVVHGTPNECRARIQQYFDAGVTTTALFSLPGGPKSFETFRALAPTVP
jgi:probable F420-dependent oxidoreductase